MKMVYVKDNLEKEYKNKGHNVARRKVGKGVLYPRKISFKLNSTPLFDHV